MLSKKHQKTLLHRRFTADVLSESAEYIYKQQIATAKTYIQPKSHSLQQALQAKPFSVRHSGSGAVLTMQYLKYTRFLDMKKTPKGKRKRNYVAIYNKIFYGTIYGYTYNALRYGLTGAVKQQLMNNMKKTYSKPI